MTAFLLTYLISVCIMALVNVIVISVVLLHYGCSKEYFWNEFKSDLVWGFTTPKIIYMLLFGAFMITGLVFITKQDKNNSCEHCREVQKCQTTK